MQRPPLFESDGFIYWKNRFETYVKSKDLDLWHVITYDDFSPVFIIISRELTKDKIVPFDKQSDDLKRKLAKNNEAKMEKDITPKDRKHSKKMTKPDTEWKSCKRQGQSTAKEDSQSQSQLNKSTVKTNAVIEEYIWLQSHPSDGQGMGKPK
ncbi:hypothetical protein Tco_0164871 [Tanacetum coccineum]